jgi:CubicO group peptidase (beta-lactamase class C family)
MRRRILALAMFFSFAASGIACADETRIRSRAEAFVAAYNNGSIEAARSFSVDHGVVGSRPELLHDFFTRHRAEDGSLERPQIQVRPSGQAVFVIARMSRTGVWRNFQFQVENDNEDRLRLVFVAEALEPYALPAFGVDDPRFTAWMDGFIANLRQTQPFYGVIAVRRGNRIVYQRAFGLADAENLRPNSVDTRFGMASGSKMFTAVAILQLAERGLLGLDDPFVRFVPEAADLPGARLITIRNLITHTSGINNYWDAEYERDWGNITEHLQLLAHVLRNFGSPTPGAYEYSNSNFALLGLIVERASRENFYDYVHAHIFAPAGMAATSYPLRSRAGVEFAEPYDAVMEAGAVAVGRHAPVVLGERGSGAGGASTTAADMLAFDRALRAGVLVRRETLAEMSAMQAREPGDRQGYGYGFIVNDGQSYGHEGSARGTQFAFRRYDTSDTSVVVISNYNTIAGPEIASALDRLLTR